MFIGLAGMVVAVWALAKGSLTWANIATRKAASGVLAASFVVMLAGGGLSPQDDDKVAVQAGSSESTSTTVTVETTTSTEPTTTTTAAPTTSSSAPTTTTARVTTTTAKPAATTTTRPATTTSRPTTTTAKPATTTTTKPAPTSGALSFGSMQCDAPGSDSASNVVDEWVELVNSGPAISLTGWGLHDEGPNYTYSFPSAFTLPVGGRVKIHSGSGTDTATDLYWGRSQHVWNNTGDTASLVNASGALVTSKGC
jgi:competence protein ComEC